jgi:CxxC motif-containing protein
VSLEDAFEKRLAEFRASLQKTGTVNGTSGTKVVLLVEGVSMTLPRLSTYTPVTNGDVVIVNTLTPGAWYVVGKPA